MKRDYFIQEFRMTHKIVNACEGKYIRCDDCGMEFLDTEERFYDVGFARGQHKTLCTRCTLYTIFENYSADEIIDKFKDGTIEEITDET